MPRVPQRLPLRAVLRCGLVQLDGRLHDRAQTRRFEARFVDTGAHELLVWVNVDGHAAKVEDELAVVATPGGQEDEIMRGGQLLEGRTERGLVIPIVDCG